MATSLIPKLVPLPLICYRAKKAWAAVYNDILQGRLPAQRLRGRWYAKPQDAARYIAAAHAADTAQRPA